MKKKKAVMEKLKVNYQRDWDVNQETKKDENDQDN